MTSLLADSRPSAPRSTPPHISSKHDIGVHRELNTLRTKCKCGPWRVLVTICGPFGFLTSFAKATTSEKLKEKVLPPAPLGEPIGAFLHHHATSSASLEAR